MSFLPSSSSSYAEDVASVFWKIDGLEVTPRAPRSTRPANVPSFSQSRRMLSIQGL